MSSFSKDVQSLKIIYDNEATAKTGNTETVVSQLNEMEQEDYEEGETNKAGFKQSETTLRGADTGRQTVEYDGRSIKEVPGEQKGLTNCNAEVSNERIVPEAEWSPKTGAGSVF